MAHDGLLAMGWLAIYGSVLRWTSRWDSLRWDGLLGQRRWKEIDKIFRSLKAESLGLKLQLEKKTYSIIFNIRSPKFETLLRKKGEKICWRNPKIGPACGGIGINWDHYKIVYWTAVLMVHN